MIDWYRQTGAVPFVAGVGAVVLAVASERGGDAAAVGGALEAARRRRTVGVRRLGDRDAGALVGDADHHAVRTAAVTLQRLTFRVHDEAEVRAVDVRPGTRQPVVCRITQRLVSNAHTHTHTHTHTHV